MMEYSKAKEKINDILVGGGCSGKSKRMINRYCSNLEIGKRFCKTTQQTTCFNCRFPDVGIVGERIYLAEYIEWLEWASLTPNDYY